MFADINEITRGGIVPSKWLRQAVQDNVISSDIYKIQEQNFQPASLDLSLGEKAYSLQCSFLPLGCSVESKLPDLQISEIDIRDGAILEKGRAYLIPLLEELHLPPGIRAKTNPKSSTGRLDIFTRVITDFSDQFDEIIDGYEGRMYLEVFSRSFTIKVQTRLSLNQLRLFKGDSACMPGELQEVHHAKTIVFADAGQPSHLSEPNPNNTVGLSVDLTGTSDGIGFRARKNSSLLDLSRTNHYHPADFWEPVYADEDHRLILEPEEFYLLSSTESVGIPPEFAAEMTAYDTSSGELRTHYAGFFDPGFGHGEDGRLGGVQPVLEVRAHDVPFMIGPGQKICTLAFEKMLEPPEEWYGPKVGSSYQEAGRILSKHFKPGVATRQMKMFEGRVG